MSDTLVVVPVFMRDPDDLRVTLATVESVRATEPNVDVLLVDDHSPAPGLVDELSGHTERLQFALTVAQENRGFSRTANVGLRQALVDGQDAVLLNADIEVLTPDWSRIMRETRGPDGELADVVGALLVYPPGELVQHAGVFFCSPADEPVLTVQDGYVPIGDLDSSQHGLVSYARKENRIFRAVTQAGRRMPGSGRRAGGYTFERQCRPYDGPLLSIASGRHCARVTPNHRLTVHWTEEALASHAVYLMRRGQDWRIGHTKMAHGGSPGTRGWALGPRLRLDQQRADALWILSLHETKQEALQAENLLAWSWQVPTLQFRASGTGIEQKRLDHIWRELHVTANARELLRAHGRDPELPLLTSCRIDGRRRAPVGSSRRYELTAANLMSGYMRVPTDPGSGQRPEPHLVNVEEAHYRGNVYSLGVAPHEHYVSGGVVVHNSLLERIFDHRFRFAPESLPEVNEPARCIVTGAFQFIRHATLQRVGVYDERYRMAWEDVQFCLRVFEAGGQCIYNPEVRAIHHESLFRGRADRKLSKWQEHSLKVLLDDLRDVDLGQFVPEMADDRG